MSEPAFDLAAAHRWFAGEFSRRAADLAKQTSRTSDESREMLQWAHAAAVHWQADNTPLSAQRAANLLALAYLKAGNYPLALEYAQRGLSLSGQTAASQTPFDRASILAVAAKVHNFVGNSAEALRLIIPALEEADKLGDGERAEFDSLYGDG